MSTKRSTVMFATRLDRHGGGEYLAGFAHDERVARIYFYKPVERVVVRDLHEGEVGDYWAWWDAKKARFDFVFPSRSLVDMCFPYGSKIETEKGNGEIVNVFVETSDETSRETSVFQQS